MTNDKKGLWLLTAVMALGGCDGTAIWFPEDNTRLDFDPQLDGSDYTIQVILGEEAHQAALELTNQWQTAFRLEGYSTQDAETSGCSDPTFENCPGGWSSGLTSAPYYLGSSVTLPNGEVGHLWRIDIDLFSLGVYYEHEAYGPSFKLRLFRKAEDGSWVPVQGLTVSVNACLDLLAAGELLCPYTDEVRIRHPNYVPNVTRGWVSTTNGNDFSRCVPNLESQADQIYRYHTRTKGEVRFNGDEGTHKHNQGFVRFPGWDVSDGTHRIRVAVSFDDDEGFVTILHNRPVEVTSWKATGARELIDIRQEYGHNGGGQAHGNVAVIGMESPYDSSMGGGVLFVRSTGSGDDIVQEIVNSFEIRPQLAVQHGMTSPHAASAGFVKLASGYYLLAVAGAHDGTEGVWFFESSETEISSYTDWYLVDAWKPTCTGWGHMESGEHCWAGAAASVNLLTDCGGDVYMYNLHGVQGVGTKDYSYTQLWHLAQDGNGRVDPTFILERRKSLGRLSAKDPSCRWACGVYTMPDGKLTMAAMIKQKAGLRNNIETYEPRDIALKSAIPLTYSDDAQEDDAVDVQMLPDDWTQEIEDAYDAANGQ